MEQISRRLTPVVQQRVEESPVLLLEGPRGVGKSTLLRELSGSTKAPIFDLDQAPYLQLAQDSLTTLVEQTTPVFIDEYQRLPKILDAIKARLNRETEPGMFVLAGSASYDSLPRGTQALTGRIQRLPVMPFTQTEIDNSDNHFIQEAFEGRIPHTIHPANTTRMQYTDRVMRGGMPLALSAVSEAARQRWFGAHVRQSLDRDAGELRRIGRKTELNRVLTRTAGNTGGLLNVNRLASGLEVSRDTVTAYLELLESLFLISALPAWGVTVVSRSVAAPKIHVVDSGIGAHLMRLSADKLRRLEPTPLTEFGHLLESFVVGEILRQLSWMDEPVKAGHWRTRDADEVDLVLERYNGAVIAIEIKAGDHVDRKQLSPLIKLRERLGSAFVAGIAFHLGQIGYQADDRIHILPLDRLWV